MLNTRIMISYITSEKNENAVSTCCVKHGYVNKNNGLCVCESYKTGIIVRSSDGRPHRDHITYNVNKLRMENDQKKMKSGKR